MIKVLCGAAVAALAVGMFGFTSAASAQPGVSVDIGTPGVGVEANYKLNDKWAIRGALDTLSYSRDEDLDDISYKGKLKSATFGAFADWHPTGGSFFLSGGAYTGSRKLKLRATPTTNVEIGDTTYTPTQVGVLEGKVEMSKFQPFLGIGYDHGFNNAWGLRAVLGAAFSKSPDVALSCSGGTLCTTPTFQAELAKEQAEVSDDAKILKAYPIVQVGLTKRF